MSADGTGAGRSTSGTGASYASDTSGIRDTPGTPGTPGTLTVRDAAFRTLRHFGLTTVFANPGSTEVPLLADFPDDLRFLLALHEGSVIGMATGHALATERPALALLHTVAGLGNAVGALATARVNRAPLVVLVGQQDRRHLALEPFLTGKLTGLAGDYPVWHERPARPQDVPSALARAHHEAVTHRGPALVVVPMDDWSAPYDYGREVVAAPAGVQRPVSLTPADVRPLADFLAGSRTPALVVGAGADSPAAWAALTALAERLRCPVWQESFEARAGFPQDHPLYAGVLPAERDGVRARLADRDAVLTVGAPVFRQYPYEPGPLVPEGTRVAVVTDDPDEAHRSPADLAVLADPGEVCAQLAARLPAREHTVPRPPVRARPPAPPAPPGPGEPLRPVHVLAALARGLPRETIVVEECPSARADLHALLPAREPLGYVSAAMGGLGFALPAAAGLRLGRPHRPVVAVVGDGSALYGIQALWSAVRYGAGVLFVVLSNGRYAVLDGVAAQHGAGAGPWPAFEDISVAGLATAMGCASRSVQTHADLLTALHGIVPTLSGRTEPILLDVTVTPES
ncbi:thiamine pyrophosphate-dependent enzyme [Streptomyces sp. NPDC054796]